VSSHNAIFCQPGARQKDPSKMRNFIRRDEYWEKCIAAKCTYNNKTRIVLNEFDGV